MKFRFRLETLLKLKTAERDEKQAELAQAEQALAIRAEDKRRISDEIAAIRVSRRQNAEPGAVNVDELLDAQRYEMLIGLDLREIDGQLATLSQAVAMRRKALLEANREVKSLEKLRESQLQDFIQAQAGREMKALDEIASIRSGRK